MRFAWILLVGVIAGCVSESPQHTPLQESLENSYERWEAQAPDIQRADSVATKYIYSTLSDNVPKAFNLKAPHCNRQAAIKAGMVVFPRDAEVPKEFTIQGVLFSGYQKKYSSCRWNGVKQIIISYFDPQTFPNWKEIGGMYGGFPAYFTVTVDVMKSQVVDHAAHPY